MTNRPPLSCFRSHPLLVAAVSFALAASLPAAVTFTVADTGPGTAGSATTSLSGASVSSDVSSFPSVSYTLTNVDLSSIGGSTTEQIVFSVAFSTTTTGGSIGSNATNGNVFTAPGNPADQINTAENLIATLTLTSTTFQGGSLSNLSAGFTTVTIGGVTNAPNLESWDIVSNGITYSRSGMAQTALTIPSFSSYTIQNVATTGGNAGVNNSGYTITFNAVPEPRAAFLGSLGLSVLLRRRRQRTLCLR